MASKARPEPGIDILHDKLIAEYEEEIIRLNGENARLYAREASLKKENQQLLQGFKLEINRRVTATVKNDILEAYQRANGEVHASFNNNFKFIVDSKIDMENRYVNERAVFQRRILNAESRIAELEGLESLRNLKSGVQRLFTSVSLDSGYGMAGDKVGSSTETGSSDTIGNTKDDDDTGGVKLVPREARDETYALATRGTKIRSQNSTLSLHPPYPEWEALIEDCKDTQVLRDEFKELYKLQRERKLLVIDGCEDVAALKNECKNSRRWLETRIQKIKPMMEEDKGQKIQPTEQLGRWMKEGLEK